VAEVAAGTQAAAAAEAIVAGTKGPAAAAVAPHRMRGPRSALQSLKFAEVLSLHSLIIAKKHFCFI